MSTLIRQSLNGEGLLKATISNFLFVSELAVAGEFNFVNELLELFISSLNNFYQNLFRRGLI